MAKKAVRPIRIEGKKAFVPLTRGYEAMIDASDADFIGQWNWHVHVCSHTNYAKRAEYPNGRQKTIYMHNAILKTPDSLEPDHIDCNGLNNMRDNLRVVTREQNLMNRRVSKNSKTKLKGIVWIEWRQKYRAMIMAYGKRVFIGYFDDIEDAKAAYIDANKEYHGEHGRI